MAQVQCVKDHRLDVNYPREWPAWAEVDTRDGRTLRSQVEYPKGDPQNPLTWDELKQKFLTLSAPVISSRQQHRLIAAIESLDALEDTRDLETLLAKPSGLSKPLER